MTEPLLIERQRVLLRDLARLSKQRAEREAEIETRYRTQKEAAEKEYGQAGPAIHARLEADKATAEKEHAEARDRITKRFQTDYSATEKEYADTRQAILDGYEKDKEAAETGFQETRWTSSTLFEADKTGTESESQILHRKVSVEAQKIQPLHQEAKKILKECRMQNLQVAVDRNEKLEGDPVQALQDRLTEANTLLAKLRTLPLPKLFKSFLFLLLFVLLFAIVVGPIILLIGTNELGVGLLVSALVSLVIGGGLIFGLFAMARSQVHAVYQPFCQALLDADVARKRAQEQATDKHQRQVAQTRELRDKHDTEQRRIKEEHQQQLVKLKQRRNDDLRKADNMFRPKLAELLQQQERNLKEAETAYQRKLAEAQTRFDTASRQGEEKQRRLLDENQRTYDADWQRMADDWRQGMARVKKAVEDINTESGRLFPAWSDPLWKQWMPPERVPPALQFGSYQVAMERIPQGIPQDTRLRGEVPPDFALPALLAFPRHCSVLFKASEEGRTPAVLALQAMMMRLLTTIPPSKVRFTVIDPVGLGENFATFMHLADHDEALVTNRIWTETNHIEQRLADVTAHMENVIQKYLRNQYPTIEDYNAQAGEVAEPFRVVVVANFPVNFSAEAARRLVSIASSGARCGVYTLITVDTNQKVPQGFNLLDLEQPSVNLIWQAPRFVWKDPDFEQYPLDLDRPPSDAFSTEILQQIGAAAKEANRVEVPFEWVAPPKEQWWTTSSAAGVRVPLGRAGATKRQHLHLGVGTAQHALVAGKTGSGKSTLLHALVTNAALLYSPEELELYLVDFKKGVEFKTYATHALPHARVVAIESEREFGLSVLQRLDAELKRRGDRFRELGAQDLNACRQADPKNPYPRVLLVVDEFQEFFVEDDKLAQEAALVLDRLVRQGRAFGIHVLLGSQTLGGAYSLARSTIDQMAIRIALQCSEADGHLILSEDNSAARLVSRPGEAIYNDANGLVAGNNPFQVVWLSDERREEYLERINELARRPGRRPAPPQIVFEGNIPADPSKNPFLHKLLSHPQWPAELAGRSAARSYQAWLGDAVAIKDPTAASFRRQAGGNLLIIGQHDDMALGIMATALVSLAGQNPPGDETGRNGAGRFYVLDGGHTEPAHAEVFPRVAETLPQAMQAGSWRDAPQLVNEIAEEVDRRQRLNEMDAPPIFLFIYGLHKFRDLKRQEEDFGFSRIEEGQPPNPARQFATILREGPPVGVHTIAWCDSLNNVQRSLDRQGMREFELRVLFQMSAIDSSNLIDTPLASKLGVHRALFHAEEQGKLEKFRPYGLPSAEWLAWVRQQFAAKPAPLPAAT